MLLKSLLKVGNQMQNNCNKTKMYNKLKKLHLQIKICKIQTKYWKLNIKKSNKNKKVRKQF